MGVQVTISTNDDRFFDALSHPAGFGPYMARKGEEIGQALVSELKDYPPTTEANEPGRRSLRTHRPMGFYERGRGWWEPVTQRSALGRKGREIDNAGPFSSKNKRGRSPTKVIATLAGAKVLNVAGYKLRATSQQLGERWGVEMRANSNSAVVIVTNAAWYSEYVVGYLQQMLLKKYGWKTVEEVLNSDYFDEVVRQRTNEALTEYYNLGGFGL